MFKNCPLCTPVNVWQISLKLKNDFHTLTIENSFFCNAFFILVDCFLTVVILAMLNLLEKLFLLLHLITLLYTNAQAVCK